MLKVAVTKSYRLVGPASMRKSLHRLRAERALGKPLPPQAVVHHADGSRSDDAPLVICQDQAYHKLLHVRAFVKAKGGDPNVDLFCRSCNQIKPKSEFHNRHGSPIGVVATCKACKSAYDQQRWIKRNRGAA